MTQGDPSETVLYIFLMNKFRKLGFIDYNGGRNGRLTERWRAIDRRLH
jgi:hypothetical protein